jgi:hypothetical protein
LGLGLFCSELHAHELALTTGKERAVRAHQLRFGPNVPAAVLYNAPAYHDRLAQEDPPATQADVQLARYCRAEGVDNRVGHRLIEQRGYQTPMQQARIALVDSLGNETRLCRTIAIGETQTKPDRICGTTGETALVGIVRHANLLA